jgi:hypothetical protein
MSYSQSPALELHGSLAAMLLNQPSNHQAFWIQSQIFSALSIHSALEQILIKFGEQFKY